MVATASATIEPYRTAIRAAPVPSTSAADCSSATGIVCAPNTSPKRPRAREAIVSTCALVTVARRRGARRGTRHSAAGISALCVQPGKDPVFDRAAEQVDLRGSRSSDLHVLRADAVEVLAGRRMGDAELHRHELQRQSRGVQVQHVALTPAELGLRE